MMFQQPARVMQRLVKPMPHGMQARFKTAAQSVKRLSQRRLMGKQLAEMVVHKAADQKADGNADHVNDIHRPHCRPALLFLDHIPDIGIQRRPQRRLSQSVGTIGRV